MSGIEEGDFNRNSLHGVQFGKLYKIVAEKPYYFLEVRKAENEGGDFRSIRLASARELLSSSVIRGKIYAELGVLIDLKRNEWQNMLQELPTVTKEDETPSKADPVLRRMFEKYLAYKPHHTSNLLSIKVDDKVYFKNDVYHFCLEGFRTYLRMKNKPHSRINFRKQLISFGCREGEIPYTRADGTILTVECWMKDADDSLREMAVCYQDMLDKNAQIIAENRLNKHDNEEAWDEPWYVEKGTMFE